MIVAMVLGSQAATEGLRLATSFKVPYIHGYYEGYLLATLLTRATQFHFLNGLFYSFYFLHTLSPTSLSSSPRPTESFGPKAVFISFHLISLYSQQQDQVGQS